MSRDYVDYTEEQDKNVHQKVVDSFTDLPLKVELSFKSKDRLKREVWDNARQKGWLSS